MDVLFSNLYQTTTIGVVQLKTCIMLCEAKRMNETDTICLIRKADELSSHDRNVIDTLQILLENRY